MTGQISDSFFFNGEKYSFVASQPRFDFTPKVFDLTPASVSSACWRGFWCKYDISERGVYLRELYIHTEDEAYPDILNVKVSDIEYTECMAYRIIDGKWIEKQTKTEKYMGHRQYKNLMYPINYTGNIVLGKGFIHRYYMHLGIQRFYTYKTLVELELRNGKVINCIDRSAIAALVRDKIDASGKDMSDFPDVCSIVKQVNIEKGLDNIWWLK